MFNIDNIKEKKHDKYIYNKLLTQQNSPKRFLNKINHPNKLQSVKKPKKVKQISKKLNVSSNISIDAKEKNNLNISMKNMNDKKLKVSNFSPDIEDNRENAILLQKIKNIQIQTSLMKKELKKYDKYKKTLNEKSTININNNKKTIQSIDSSDYNYKTINNDLNKNENHKKNSQTKEKFTNGKKNTSKLNSACKIKKTQNIFENKRLLTITDFLNDKNTKISYNISSRLLQYKNGELKKNLISKKKNDILNKSAENRRKKKYKNKLDLSHSNTHRNHLIKSKSRSKSKSKSRSIIDKNFNGSISPIRTMKYKEVIGKSYQKKAHNNKLFFSKNGSKRISTNTNLNSSTNTRTNLRKENYLNKTNINISKSMEKIKKEKTKKIYKSKSVQGINSYNVISQNKIKKNNEKPKETEQMKKKEKENGKLIEKEKAKEKEKLIEKKIINIEKLCKKGFAGPGEKKENQDNYFIYNNFNNDSNNIYFGVCDGHGDYGKDISAFIVTNLPLVLGNFLRIFNIKDLSSTESSTLFQISKNSFIQVNKNLFLENTIDCSLSGSTCVSLIYTPKKIFCINAGDSQCVIGRFNGKNWESKDLSIPHKPDDKKEKERIINSGGIVSQVKDENGELVGPLRIWLKEGELPGLSVSRSFGDQIAHQVGVICEPEVVEYNLHEEDKFIILASDGIWQFISSQECIDIIKDYYIKQNYKGAMKHLYKEACNRWLDEEGEIDDITLIIIFLE